MRILRDDAGRPTLAIEPTDSPDWELWTDLRTGRSTYWRVARGRAVDILPRQADPLAKFLRLDRSIHWAMQPSPGASNRESRDAE
jgi:hypothetical protein